MAKQIQEVEIKKMMEKLEISREEAIELIQFDNNEIENEEVEELTKKAKPIAKEMAQVSRAPKEEKPKMAGVTTQTRKKKEDKVKQMIIDTISKALSSVAEIENIDVTNKEKTILFQVGDENFEIDLKKKRKSKK